MLIISAKRKKGFTLIELLIATVISTITLSALLSAFVVGRMSATRAKHHMQAINLVRTRIEWAKDQGYATLSRGTAGITADYPYRISDNEVIIDVGNDIDDDGIFDEEDGDELKGRRITQVQPVGAPEQYVEVTVTVSWNARTMTGSVSASEQLITLISI